MHAVRRLLIVSVVVLALGGCTVERPAPGPGTRPAPEPSGSLVDLGDGSGEATPALFALDVTERAFLEAHERYMREYAGWVPVGRRDARVTLDAGHLMATRLAAVPESDAFAFLAARLADLAASGEDSAVLEMRIACSYAINAHLLEPSLTRQVAARITARAEHAVDGLAEFGRAGVLPGWLVAERDVQAALIDIAAAAYANGSGVEFPASVVDTRTSDPEVIDTVVELMVLEAGANAGESRDTAPQPGLRDLLR